MSTKGGVLTFASTLLLGEAQIIGPQGEKKTINLKMSKKSVDWSRFYQFKGDRPL